MIVVKEGGGGAQRKKWEVMKLGEKEIRGEEDVRGSRWEMKEGRSTWGVRESENLRWIGVVRRCVFEGGPSV